MITMLDQAKQRAKKSRLKLMMHLDHIAALDEALYPLLLSALIDARIEGTLEGLDMMQPKPDTCVSVHPESIPGA